MCAPICVCCDAICMCTAPICVCSLRSAGQKAKHGRSRYFGNPGRFKWQSWAVTGLLQLCRQLLNFSKTAKLEIFKITLIKFHKLKLHHIPKLVLVHCSTPRESCKLYPCCLHIPRNPTAPLDFAAQISQGLIWQYCMERFATVSNRDSRCPPDKKLQSNPILPKIARKSSITKRLFSTNKL
jgi:hypothetical protein